MTATGEPWYEPLQWVLVRTPLLPVERWLELADGEPGLDDPGVRRALAVASPSLQREVEQDGLADARVRQAVLRYLIRMSTRPTPYGLNAGVSLARWGERTDLALADADVVRARLDMGLLLALVGALEGRLEVASELAVQAHPLVAVRAGRAFLPERFAGEGEAVAVSVRATGPVVRALELARAAPVPFGVLAATLAEEHGASSEQAERLVFGLVREGLLVTDLRPPLTGGPPAEHVLERLASIPAAEPERERLEAAVAACARWERLAPDAGARAFAGLARDLVPGHGGATVHVDLARPLAGDAVTSVVAREAARAAELLVRMSSLPAGIRSLNAYRDRFLERYPPQAEVPLAELLDPQLGLGPLPLDLDRSAVGADGRGGRRERRLLALAASALHAGATGVELDEAALADLATGAAAEDVLPTVELSVLVAAPSRQALDAGDFALVVSPGVGSYGAGRILGRFASLFDARGERALREAADRQEAQAPGLLAAELVHAPDRGWLGNMAIRPATRSHEIVVGVTPGVERERVIPVAELVVGVSDDRFVVRWPRGGAYVDVAAGHMLSPRLAPSVAAFLGQLRSAGRPLLTEFSWGPAQGFPRLPRVSVGRIVLSPASWRPFGVGGVDATASDPFAAALRAWGERWELPRRVYAAEGDHRLLVDLDVPAQVEVVRRLAAAADGPELVLQEALPGVGDAWLPGPGGQFLCELTVPLARRAAPPPRGRERPADSVAPPARAARLRPPGSDWLYAKLYADGAVADELVGDPLRAFAAAALDDGHAEDWFFVRFADPAPHLRVRFRGDPAVLASELQPRLSAWAAERVAAGDIGSVALDTYEREVDRYGGEAGIAAAEAVFGADSRAVAELVALDLAAALSVERRLVAVLAVDRLLGGLGLDEAARLAWCARWVPSRADAGAAWREHKDRLRAVVGGGPPPPLADVLDRRDEEMAGAASALARVRWPSPDEVAASLVHMHCNRLLGTDRAAERGVLGLLARTRDSLSRAPVA
jgi:thiopeptide-type bacteriocin biosynthesis protein